MLKASTIVAMAATLGLSSCYFNSAGHLFDKAGYKAQVDSADAKVGQYVYTDGTNYYVQLPRYRYGKPIVTQMVVGEDKKEAVAKKTGGVDVFTIPEDFAMYLIGKRNAPAAPSFMTKADENVIKTTATTQIPIVRDGGASKMEYRYSSPNKAWWYTAGVFEWLCVDLPITCVENALAISGFAVMLYVDTAQEYNKTKAKWAPAPGGGGGGGDYSTSEAAKIDAYRHKQEMEYAAAHGKL